MLWGQIEMSITDKRTATRQYQRGATAVFSSKVQPDRSFLQGFAHTVNSGFKNKAATLPRGKCIFYAFSRGCSTLSLVASTLLHPALSQAGASRVTSMVPCKGSPLVFIGRGSCFLSLPPPPEAPCAPEALGGGLRQWFLPRPLSHRGR